MYTPFDYQLDYLNAMHMIYYAFPPNVEITYYKISNKDELREATEKTGSTYAHLLDDTSIAKFWKVSKLPGYFTEYGQKTNQANEYGNLYHQQQLSITIPGIYGLDPNIEDVIQFSSTGTISRLYVIKNIEINNIHENNPLRLYKLILEIDKYPDSSEIENRVEQTFTYSRKFETILLSKDFDYIETQILNLLVFFLNKLEISDKEYSNVILSKLYADYKMIFKVILEYFTFSKLKVLEKYQDALYSSILDNKIVVNIPDLDLFEVQNFISDYTSLSTDNVLGQFNLDLDTYSLQMIDYFEGKNELYYLAGIKLMLDKILSIIGD